MAQQGDQQDFYDQQAKARQQAVELSAGYILEHPQVADEINRTFNTAEDNFERMTGAQAGPPDGGLAQLAGIGPQAARSLGEVRIPPPVLPYDETLMSERMIATGDLYYLYQHEKIGVFRVVEKLHELFQTGAVRLSDGDGARRLYQYDRREVLRYTKRDRLIAYRRAFGYGSIRLPAGITPNVDFHRLFAHFNNQVALFWRDKRIADVMRERVYDPSFGSIAIVRRSGLDLRNNLKFTSYGHINVMRVEMMQLLEEAFKILGADDVKHLFGVENAWDVVDEVLVRYFNRRLVTSPRQRMAVTGREVLHWLAHPHVLHTERVPFEALLLQIAEPAEEWLTSAQSLDLAPRLESSRVLPWDDGGSRFADGARRQRTRRRTRPAPRSSRLNGNSRQREYEHEL
jgi:hypothetical protein